MNNSYFSYIKSRNPIKLLSNILRYYRRNSQDAKDGAVKKHQSEPAMVMMNKNGALGNQDESEESLKDKKTVRNASGLSSKVSSESLKITWSNSNLGKTSSAISLHKKSSYLDLSLRDKLVHMPLKGLEKRKEIAKCHSYPWQNFNLEEKHIYHKIRPVNNLSLEFFKNKKSSLKRQKVPKPQITRSVLKEMKFNKNAAMMFHPNVMNHNVMRQARINLSTTARHTVGDNGIFRKQPTAVQAPKVIVNRKKKHFNEDGRGHFWYISKKSKIL